MALQCSHFLFLQNKASLLVLNHAIKHQNLPSYFQHCTAITTHIWAWRYCNLMHHHHM